MLLFNVNGQSLKRTDHFNPATDSVEYLKAKFTFNDSAWSGKTKTAYFRRGMDVYKSVLDTSGTCKVPSEVLVCGGGRVSKIHGDTVHVSLVGEYSTIRITTDEIPVKLNASGYADANTPADPTESEYQQMATVAADAVAEAEAARTECENARADLEGVKNIFANAVKGYLSGAVVFADDASPVKHNPVVKVHGKNRVVYPYAEANTTRDGITWTIDESDNGLVVNGTAAKNTSFNVSMQAQKNIPLKKGKTYTFSCNSGLTGSTGYVYIQNVSNGVTWNSASVENGHATFTAAEDGFAVIGAVVLNGQTFENEKLLIQLEEGAIPTAYEPYIDPATVTVFRHGKNLAYGGSTQEIKQDGITVNRTNGSSVVTVNGTAEKSFSLVVTSSVLLSAGTYTVSVYGLNAVGDGLDRCYVWDQDNGKVLANTIMTGKPRTFTLTEPHKARIEIVFGAGSVYSNKKVRLQMECGYTATDYVECDEPTTHIPAADGTVSSVTSLSPNMTILPDTVGATVDCEYNRDTNKVIDKLINAITALGGTV